MLPQSRERVGAASACSIVNFAAWQNAGLTSLPPSRSEVSPWPVEGPGGEGSACHRKAKLSSNTQPDQLYQLLQSGVAVEASEMQIL